MLKSPVSIALAALWITASAIGVSAEGLSVTADAVVLAGEECPPDALAGQDPGLCTSNWFFYSDLEYCSGANCVRVHCDNFPAPGQTITRPIGVVTWQGVYTNAAGAPCTKAVHRFRIRLYQDQGGAPKNPTTGYYTECATPLARDTGQWSTSVSEMQRCGSSRRSSAGITRCSAWSSRRSDAFAVVQPVLHEQRWA